MPGVPKLAAVMTDMMSSSTSWASCWAAACHQRVEQVHGGFRRFAGGDVDRLELVAVERDRDRGHRGIRVGGVVTGEVARPGRRADQRHAHGVALVGRLRAEVGGERRDGHQVRGEGHERLLGDLDVFDVGEGVGHGVRRVGLRVLGLVLEDEGLLFGGELAPEGGLRGRIGDGGELRVEFGGLGGSPAGVTRAGSVVPVEATTRATSVWTRVSKSAWDAWSSVTRVCRAGGVGRWRCRARP